MFVAVPIVLTPDALGSKPSVVILAISVTGPDAFTLKTISSPISFPMCTSLSFWMSTLKSPSSPNKNPWSLNLAKPWNALPPDCKNSVGNFPPNLKALEAVP